MEATKAVERVTGSYVNRKLLGVSYRAFVPKSLPPDPPLQLTPEMFDLMERANRALGRLDGITTLLPDAYLFTYFYLRKEAVLSSQIEGTQSSLSELLLFESEQSPGIPLDDPRQVLNYVNAMYYGLNNVKGQGGLPISLRLMKEMHSILLKGSRGQNEDPGEFRTVQNWIGGSHPQAATYVGPPHEKMLTCLDAFEKFLHGVPSATPVLIKAALAHVQFESIHPFRDGNGRLGRLLISLLLCAEGALSEPMLYLSLFFKTNRSEYYRRLQDVRERGDWEGWVCFVLKGVLETSEQAVAAAKQTLILFNADRTRIEQLGRATSMLRLHQYLQQKAVISIQQAVRALNISEPTIGKCVNALMELGVVREVTGKTRRRVFIYDQYLKILDEGTQPLTS
jgi:Fic family protein